MFYALLLFGLKTFEMVFRVDLTHRCVAMPSCMFIQLFCAEQQATDEMKEVEAVFQEASEGQDENIIDMSDAGDVDAIVESIERDAERDGDHVDEVPVLRTTFNI